ncbi:MAG TPA: VWA domain-containing protein [Candidatus Bathyarchaeia archaeon]|nr:VWA domain-containing protein [Candidatus Bathyarchaeia archaeon]
MNMISYKLLHLRWPFAILLVFSLVAMPCLAQNPSAPAPAPATPAATEQQPMQVGPTIKKESRLVLVDTVVTDKKGNYLHDLSKNDFRVFEDNKEQTVVSFSSGADAATPQNPQKHYLVLFFDNSSMALPDQISARAAATKFIQSNAAPDRLMAVVEFTGAIRIVQNFTANAELLQAAAKGVKSSYVASNSDPGGPGASTAGPSTIETPGLASFSISRAQTRGRQDLSQ